MTFAPVRHYDDIVIGPGFLNPTRPDIDALITYVAQYYYIQRRIGGPVWTPFVSPAPDDDAEEAYDVYDPAFPVTPYDYIQRRRDGPVWAPVYC
ncbi:hypothetical protein SAMN02745823_01532 [Sporobacter termitidis DSM 10068]|uniref:Uncharacterized protein n=1 Tax=Sporobacter termitidis DSM 10068 TaxID=1123282 RepID=A0A1M5X1V1_9FIRM|nr:hypothetical protein [Sporobacter termitidis]SHH93789.1 hypothetical protein SAMN02745823_01532 [Sporobacter termitidis DSM 10068]